MRVIATCFVGTILCLACAGALAARTSTAWTGDALIRPTMASATVRVSGNGDGAYSEPSLAVNPRHPRNLLGTAYLTPAAHAMNGGRLPVTFVSFDGGASWHDNGPLPLPGGYSSGSNLVVVFTADGTGIVVVRGDSGPDHTAILAWRTTDGGRHFLPPVVLASGGTGGRNVDHPGVAVPPGAGEAGTMYVAWSVTTSGRSDIAFTRSTDDGQHVATPRLITGPAPQGTVAPVVTAGPHGRVAVVYGDAGASGTSAENSASFQQVPIRIIESMDGGLRFRRPRTIATAQFGALSARPLPWFGQAAAATDPRDGTLYVAMPREQKGAHHPSITLLRSRDGGQQWEALGAGSPASTQLGRDQLQPQLAVGPDGTVALSYFVQWRGRIDLYLALSHDRGARFAPPVRVTSRSWDPRLGLSVSPGQFWIGDYQGLAAGPTAVYPFWNDTSNGRLGIYTAAIALH